MKPDNKAGGPWLYALGLVPVIWFALLIAPAISGGLSEIVSALPAAMNHPFKIVWHWHLPLIQAQLPQGRGTRLRQMGRSAGRE